MRTLLATVVLTAAALTIAPAASAGFTQTDLDRALYAAADRGTPLTNDNKTVSHHVGKAKSIIKYAWRKADWRDHDFTKKRKRRVERHKDAIQAAPEHRFRITTHLIRKRNAWRKWSDNQERKADPFKHAWANMSDYDRTWAVQIGSCESGNNPTITGHYYGAMQFLLGTWRSALAILPSDLRANVASVPHANPLITQYVVAIHWRNRTSTAQWPACSRKFGYL